MKRFFSKLLIILMIFQTQVVFSDQEINKDDEKLVKGKRYIVSLKEEPIQVKAFGEFNDLKSSPYMKEDNDEISIQQSPIQGVENIDETTIAIKAEDSNQDFIEDLKQQGKVESIEEDFPRFSSSYENLNWGNEKIYLPEFKTYVKSSSSFSNLTVAVLDSGIDDSNPIFNSRVLQGYDFVDQKQNPKDYDGHGSHIAGIVASATENMNIQILPIRISSKGTAYDSDIIRGIKFAKDKGAKVINISLAGPGYSNALRKEIQKAVSQGIVIVASSGNDGKNADQFYPGGYPEVINVTAVDKNFKFANFSNKGSSIDFCAPGVDILSSVPKSLDWDGIKDGFALKSGTSMAAPFVSASIAIIKQKFPNWDYLEVKNFLAENVLDLGKPGKDNKFGYGLIYFKKFFNEEIEIPKEITAIQKLEIKDSYKKINPNSRIEISYLGKFSKAMMMQDGKEVEAKQEVKEGLLILTPISPLKVDKDVFVTIDNYQFKAYVSTSKNYFTIYNKEDFFIDIKGYDLNNLASDKIYLQRDGKKIPLRKVQKEDSQIRCKIDEETKIGDYTLVIEGLVNEKGDSATASFNIYVD